MSKRDFGTIKSLLHFDYPYFNEPNDGLGDEVSSEIWTREGNTKLAGIEIPYEILRNPKFGYRCAYFPDKESFITGTNTSGIFNLSPAGEYEIEAFVMLDTDTYEILPAQTYTTAKTACENLGGYLATITSQEEENLLKALAGGTRYSGASFWLGAYSQDGRWEWITGENSDYINNISYYADDSLLSDKATSNKYLLLSPVNGEYCVEAVSSTTNRYALCEYESERTLAGNIITIGDIELAVNEVGRITLLSKTSTATLTTKVWHHILLRLKGGIARVFLDGTEVLNVALPATLLDVETLKLGGYAGYMDEFVFRNSADSSSPEVPLAPHNGTLNIQKIGRFGDGSTGDITINSSSTVYINSYGMISGVSDERTFTVSSWANSSSEEYGRPSVGSEVMIHVTEPVSSTSGDYPYVGLYAFGRIAKIEGSNIVLKRKITTENGYDFTLSSELVTAYRVQVIVMPNFMTLQQVSGIILARSYSNSTGGGIVAFRCKGDCTLSKSIIANSGATRKDLHQMTHSKLIDRFLCANGGGIFIACGGVLRVSASSYLGANYSGLGSGGNGAAGYGGNGGAVIASGGVGGVGGGGAPGGCGGAGYAYTDSKHNASLSGGKAGACMILVCNKLAITTASISTGGGAGGGSTITNGGGAGGGGTGFCYITCKEQVSEE